IARAQSSRRSSTSGIERYSAGARSKASSSAVVPSSRAASSYAARAWPISFCAIDEKATSSSSVGAIPVHSESRQPITSSSSASSSRIRARSFTRLLQPCLERVAVDATVLEVELVGEVVHLVQRVAGDEPQRLGLAAPAVLLSRPRLGETRIGRLDGAGVLERLAPALLAEDLVDHAALPTAMRSRSAAQTVVPAKPARPDVGIDERRLTPTPRAPSAPARGSGAAARGAPPSAGRDR